MGAGIDEWRETEPNEAHCSIGDGMAVAYANKVWIAEESKEALEFIKKSFYKWDRERNPVTQMVNDLLERGCSNTTVASYRSIANSFMKLLNYQPEFTPAEYNQFMYQARESSVAVKRVYKSVLKLLWEVQGLIFPVYSRRLHQKHGIMPRKAPELTQKQIAQIIKKVRAAGTPEEKYYFCLATVWALRRVELAEITAENFTWDGKTGILTFVPHKQQGEPNVRRHHIPEELTPYLREYSYWVRPHHPQELTEKFWSFVAHLDLPIPTLSIRRRKPHQAEYEEMRKKHQRTRGYGWHAFRHSVTSSLVEAGLNDTRVNTWIGWQSGNPAAPMVRTYYTPQELDAKVVLRHPFIKFWK